jgi:uncharacterized phage-associated protein
MITSIEFDYKKAVQTLNFFALKEGGKIDKLKALKLVWLADRYHLRNFGRPIINDTYFAMEYGPVASSVKDLASFCYLSDSEDNYEKIYLEEFLKKADEYGIESVKGIDKQVFSKTDIEVLDTIYSEYGKIKPFDLAKISHKFPEWKKFENSLKSGVSREVMDYRDFFSNPEEDGFKNIFNESGEQLIMSKNIFEESYKNASYWAN